MNVDLLILYLNNSFDGAKEYFFKISSTDFMCNRIKMTECLPINIDELGNLKPGKVLISRLSECLSYFVGVSDCVRSACFQNMGNFSKFVYSLRTS